MISCYHEVEITPELELARFDVPSYISYPDDLTGVPKEGILLGEKLFNDVNLSSSGKVSCASCHLKSKAFADNLALSASGVSQEVLDRNSPALFNLAWHDSYFWDGGSPDLESQLLGPLFSEHELNTRFDTIISYLESEETYVSSFSLLFEDGEINSANIMTAFKWFQVSLLSFESKYDLFLQSNDSSLFTESELIGLRVFQENCNSCHTLPLGSSYQFTSNGIDSVFDYPPEDPRWGRYRITEKLDDVGKYKIPSVRNLSYTFPYMHDGRFGSLDEVLKHYEKLDLNEVKIRLNRQEKENLKTFLLTLNDEKFVE